MFHGSSPPKFSFCNVLSPRGLRNMIYSQQNHDGLNHSGVIRTNPSDQIMLKCSTVFNPENVNLRKWNRLKDDMAVLVDCLKRTLTEVC